jgi:hypothetical protein
MENTSDVLAQLNFLAKDPLYDVEKPYNLAYESDTVPRQNLVKETQNDVLVHDIRGKEHELTFERNGIAVLEMESQMQYTDFDHPEKIIDCYLEEIGQLLYQYMNPRSVQIFDYNVKAPCTVDSPVLTMKDSSSASRVPQHPKQPASW